MNTLHLNTSELDLGVAGHIIREGGLVAFPTETVYGLGADAMNGDAVRSVYAAKGRPSDNPMIVHIAEMQALAGLVSTVRDYVAPLMKAFWPGPITFVMNKKPEVPNETTGGLNTVAVRMPANETARRLIKAAGVPIAAPSANISGRPSPTTAEDVLEDMDGRIDAVVMGESCEVGIESTVLDCTGDVPTILRPGFITKAMLESVLGASVAVDSHLTETPETILDPEDGTADIAAFQPKSPGMKYRHYAPKAKVRIIEGDKNAFDNKALMLGQEAVAEGKKPAVLDYEGDAEKAAHKLFADLRELDRQEYDIIFIRALDKEGFGFSVMNRMLKSAGYDVIEV